MSNVSPVSGSMPDGAPQLRATLSPGSTHQYHGHKVLSPSSESLALRIHLKNVFWESEGCINRYSVRCMETQGTLIGTILLQGPYAGPVFSTSSFKATRRAQLRMLILQICTNIEEQAYGCFSKSGAYSGTSLNGP